jgi:subtilisin family serine protease
MSKWCWVPLSIALVAAASAGSLNDDLAQMLANTSPDATVSALVYLQNAVDVVQLDTLMQAERMSLQQRHELVVRELQERAQSTQGPLIQELKRLLADGKIKSFTAYWIADMIRVDATPGVIRQIAARDDVNMVYINYPIAGEQPVSQGPVTPGGRDTPEPGVVAVNAPQVWAMGYDGTGVVVATLDTGVDGTHPALASRWRGLDPRYAGHGEWAWFDPETHTTQPGANTYNAAHGTHTMGTICGGAPGDQIGVAPGAQWIHAWVIDRISLLQTCADAVLAFQWMADPCRRCARTPGASRRATTFPLGAPPATRRSGAGSTPVRRPAR